MNENINKVPGTLAIDPIALPAQNTPEKVALASNPEELVRLYKQRMHKIHMAVDQGAKVVLEGLHDPEATLTLQGDASVHSKKRDTCWRIRSSTDESLSLPYLTPQAIQILEKEIGGRRGDGKYFGQLKHGVKP